MSLLDNPKRTSRLQKMARQIADMQNDIIKVSTEMQKNHVALRSIIDQLMAEKKLPTMESLMEGARKALPAEEMAKLQSVNCLPPTTDAALMIFSDSLFPPQPKYLAYVD